MGNINRAIRKPEVLKNLEGEGLIAEEERAKPKEQASCLLKTLNEIKTLTKLPLFQGFGFVSFEATYQKREEPHYACSSTAVAQFEIPRMEAEYSKKDLRKEELIELQQRREMMRLKEEKINLCQRTFQRTTPGELDAEVFRYSQWQYGIIVPSYDIARRPILKLDTSKIEAQNLSIRGCSATFGCMWTEREEELEYFRRGYCQALFKFIARCLSLGADFNRSHQIAMRDKSRLCYLYAEQIIPKGYLDLNASNLLPAMISPEFATFFEREGVTLQTIQKFFETFGHFFPTRMLYGGKRYIIKTFTHKEVNYETKKNIEIGVSSDFNLCQSLQGEFSVKGGRETNFRSRNSITTYKYIINTEGGNPEDSRSEKDWLKSLATDKCTWAVIKVEQFVPTIDLLDEITGNKIKLWLKYASSQCFIETQHQISASFPWFKRCVMARKFEGRCPGSYLDDGCQPMSHEWSCPRCQQEIYIDKSGHLYCDCRILKKTKLRFSCPDWDHLGTTVDNYQKHCKKSITDFLKGDGGRSETTYCAKFWSNGDRYIGEFDKGMLHGQGTYCWQGGTKYMGSFVTGMLSGIGQLCFIPEKAPYRGHFEKNKFNGQGDFFYANGDCYQGQFSDGMLTSGIYFWKATPGFSQEFYQGNFVNNKRSGNGIYTWPNNDEYEGDFLNNKRTGNGTLKWTNSRITYSGEFKDGMLHGRGIVTCELSGEKFEGRFCDGRIDGDGVYTNNRGTRFHVTYYSDSDFTLNGEGELCYANKDRYKGPVVKNKLQGQGQYFFDDGDSYEGQFVAGWKHGKGKYHFANGANYEGDFIDDKPHGYGILILPDGTEFEGHFVNSNMDGHGKISYPNGDKYEGRIFHSRPHGKGRYQFANGQTYEGSFAGGRMVGKEKPHLIASYTSTNTNTNTHSNTSAIAVADQARSQELFCL